VFIVAKVLPCLFESSSPAITNSYVFWLTTKKKIEEYFREGRFMDQGTSQ